MPYGSGTPSDRVSRTNSSIKTAAHTIPDLLPPSAHFDLFDKRVIICIIAVFLFLFVWLLGLHVQPPTYAFLTFTALLTLIFVGFLRATGVLRTSWVALGGGAAVYAGLYLLTQGIFERQYGFSQEIESLNGEVQSLRAKLNRVDVDPAKDALQKFFGFLDEKNFKQAWDLISDTRKLELKGEWNNVDNIYDYWVAQFANTRKYNNVSVQLLPGGTENKRTYRVMHDVMDLVPINQLYKNSGETVASLEGSVDRRRVIEIVTGNVRQYYDIPISNPYNTPDPAISAIEEYVQTRTVNQLLDPSFIGELVIYLKDKKKISLKQRTIPGPHAEVWRYWRYDNGVVIKQNGTEWKIRGLGHPTVAVYQFYQ